MAPSVATAAPVETQSVQDLKTKAQAQTRAPLSSSHSLDKFQPKQLTPVIGTEFPEGVQIADLLSAPNSDELIRDLAILVSQRNVVFFRNQDITIDQQKELGTRLGELSGKPATSKLHIHPLTPEGTELGDDANVVSSKRFKAVYEGEDRTKLASRGWHIDITFEAVPSDYAILQIHTPPKSGGGDTLWGSAYEAYDRLSDHYKKFLEGLTAVHDATWFKNNAEELGLKKLRAERGAPENYGEDNLVNVHPLIRTNPVTGWKGLFIANGFTKRIVELTKDESDQVLKYLFSVIAENHDLQVRLRWNKNDVAIWDNRSSYHNITLDYGDELRLGNRVVSLGERPYFDPKSKSRREALAAAN